MKKIYSKPTTKFVTVNVSTSLMSEGAAVTSDPQSDMTASDEPLF